MQFVSRVGVVLFVLCVLISGLIWLLGGSFKVLLGGFLGGLLSLSSFNLLKRFGRKIVETPADPKLHYFVFIWVRFFALIAICFWLVFEQHVNVIAFACGLSCIVLAVIIATIYSIVQEYRGKEALDFEEKFIGWEDVDRSEKFGYKPQGKKTPFDEI